MSFRVRSVTGESSQMEGTVAWQGSGQGRAQEGDGSTRASWEPPHLCFGAGAVPKLQDVWMKCPLLLVLTHLEAFTGLL